jgi:cell division protein FtsW (lipid II flippase)
MILIPVPVLSQGGSNYLAILAVSGFVGGISVERIVGDKPIAD